MLQIYMQVVGLLKNSRYDFTTSMLSNRENSKFKRFSSRLFFDLMTLKPFSLLVRILVPYMCLGDVLWLSYNLENWFSILKKPCRASGKIKKQQHS